MHRVWTSEQDNILAEAVLRHIREGGTAIEAFGEVGKKLNRSAAKCGYRWNNIVRFNYENAFNDAKKYRYNVKYGKVN
ncbi:hypothetical protein CHH57_02105 [Niallia circulans]|uniref:Myb-like domain-containing protein n=1 Tax=Niallia circulans TaxID=1397 RepID=A0AA91TWQ2_NIACI|nr:hypothetical protein CHH57_02105 [Niallia circulans]